MNSIRLRHSGTFASMCLFMTLVILLPTQARSAEDHDHEEAEYVTTINDEQLALSGVRSEIAGPRTLRFSDPLFGVVATPAEAVFRIRAPYPGIVEQMHVSIGDLVTQGQTLITVENTSTLTSYTITSPARGEVTARMANRGDSTESGALLEVMDLSSVWIDLSAFAETIEKLSIGLPVTVRDMHQHEVVESQISYISPVMSGGHIARARAVIANDNGHWRPGMHITAQLHTSQREVPVAIRESALQSIEERPVVFVREGNTFEAHFVEPGESDGEYVEILAGLTAGAEYVSENSFLLKADVLKDSASHDH